MHLVHLSHFGCVISQLVFVDAVGGGLFNQVCTDAFRFLTNRQLSGLAQQGGDFARQATTISGLPNLPKASLMTSAA